MALAPQSRSVWAVGESRHGRRTRTVELPARIVDSAEMAARLNGETVEEWIAAAVWRRLP